MYIYIYIYIHNKKMLCVLRDNLPKQHEGGRKASKHVRFVKAKRYFLFVEAPSRRLGAIWGTSWGLLGPSDLWENEAFQTLS